MGVRNQRSPAKKGVAVLTTASLVCTM